MRIGRVAVRAQVLLAVPAHMGGGGVGAARGVRRCRTTFETVVQSRVEEELGRDRFRGARAP
ncbi:hypothetical protein [Streptomyces sp. ISL-100]|uniref:hypothetical protein n=1 Tax=Streptomyces sp. ISL-100 TaxID=2819173 RepID=UPI002035FC49|nr:hypothetical protein [Streptomyces sp. ISL-100]